jgi:thiol-disulfide isomerase/thioredoxin
MLPRLHALLIALCFVPAFTAVSQDPAATPASSDGQQLLQKSMAYLASLPAYSADLAMNFEMGMTGGETNKTSLTATLAVSGPDRARFRVNLDDGNMELFYAPDSKFIFLSNQNQYLKGDTFGDRQKALTLMPGREYRSSQVLLSDFLHNEKTLLDAATEVLVADSGAEGGEGPQQVRLSAGGVVTDFWIQRGEQPVLLKFTMDLTEMAAKSNPSITSAQLTYTLSNWNLAPTFSADYFSFKIPEGAVEFKPAEQPKDPLEGQPAPDIKLDLLGGGSLDLAAHKDKDVVILDFWASWCGPCRVGLPIVAEVAAQFKDKNVVLYAVNVGEDPQRAQAFVEQTGLTATVALDQKRDAQRKYGANSIPKTVIVGRDGIVHEVHMGTSPALKDQLTETLRALTE